MTVVVPSARQRIHEAALNLFSSKGFQATGIRDLTAEAGVSIATLYHYTSTKERLLQEIMEESLRKLLVDARAALAVGESSVDRLAGLTLMHVFAHGLRRRETIVVDSEVRSLTGTSRDAVIALRDEYESLWQQELDRGVHDGVMQIADARLARLAILEFTSGVAHWFDPAGPLTLEQVAVDHAQLALNLVRAQQGSGAARLAECALPEPAWFGELVSGAAV